MQQTMSERVVGWLMTKFGCVLFDIGKPDGLYMKRWFLYGKRIGDSCRLMLHRFYRSDSDEAMHDHPWAFWSLIIWPGYYEETVEVDEIATAYGQGPTQYCTVRRWKWPGMVLRRPALWRHRVILAKNKDGTERRCWTLVWTGLKERSWFFYCPKGPVPWREFIARQDSRKAGCE